MAPLNRPGLYLFLLLAALFAVLALAEHRKVVPHELHAAQGAATLPFELSRGAQNALDVKIPPSATSDLLALDVVSSHPVEFVFEGARLAGRCVAADSDAVHCRAAVPRGAEPLRVHIRAASAEPMVVVTSVRIRHLRVAYTSALAVSGLAIVLVLSLAVVPLLWLSHPHRRLSEWLLVACSVAVLALLQPLFTAALLIFLCATFALGKTFLGKKRDGEKVSGLPGITLALVACAFFLASWKYAPAALNALFANPGGFSLALPLGVSYFLIRIIDTLLHWHRGELAQVSLREYLCFVLFPATVPAGPITTLRRFAESRLERIGRVDISYGLGRIILGVAKKVVLVDFVLSGALFQADGLFVRVASFPESVSGSTLVVTALLLLCFAYLDFSAYSDIAIGASRLLGYRMVENFNLPVIARDLQDFWRRWHMSLSQWLFWNVYAPLCIKTKIPLLALFSTMVAAGMWHTFSLPWGIWAVHHTVGLAALAALHSRSSRRTDAAQRFWWRIPASALTLLYAAAGFYLVFIRDFPSAVTAYGRFWRALLPV